MTNTTVWIFLIASITGFSCIALLLALRFMVPQARKLLAALVAFEALLALLHVIFTPAGNTFASWLFNLNLELTAGAVFSAAQYTVIALIALVNGLRTPQIRPMQRVFWAVLVVLFVWLCADEFLELHESVDSWRSFYALTGVALAVFSVAMYWFFFDREELWLFVPFLIGLAIMGSAGVVLDVLTNDHDLVVAGIRMGWLDLISCDAPWNPVECGDVNTYGFTEEFLEMGGASLVLTSLANYFFRRQPPERVRQLRRLAIAASATWVVVWASNFWLLPSVVTAVESEAVQADYLDGRLSLIGYDLSKDVLLPGETLTVNLYFRANVPLDEDYLLALKLMTRYDDNPIAEADAQLGEWRYPTSAWIPGVTVRHTARLRVPENMPTPRAYWLTVRVWHEDDEVEVATEMLESGQGTIVLHGIPVLSPQRPPEPPIPADYRFAAGPILTGYDLPERVTAGEPMVVRFWWRTDAPVPVDLNQFVHVLVPGSEDPFTFDQAPFGGENFPTVYWPKGMEEMARWEIPLPPDLEPGVYGVYTGLYTLPDVIREPVTRGSGEPVLNNAIYLGDILVEAP
ncbi:MAG: hypothetical protein WBH90_04795 [Aggregatilineales bacterium]